MADVSNVSMTSTDNALHVKVITSEGTFGASDSLAVMTRGPLGTLSLRHMAPVLQAAANFANPDEFVTDATGFKAFRVSALTIPAGQAIVVGFSSVASDSAAIKVTIDAIATAATGEFFTPDGVVYTGVIELHAAQLVGPWVYAYGGSGAGQATVTIKSIGIEQTGGTLTTVLLETIS